MCFAYHILMICAESLECSHNVKNTDCTRMLGLICWRARAMRTFGQGRGDRSGVGLSANKTLQSEREMTGSRGGQVDGLEGRRDRGATLAQYRFFLWVLKSRSLSLWPMNRAPLYCFLHACSDNEDTTKLFSSSISRLLSITQSLIILERKDYNVIMSRSNT